MTARSTVGWRPPSAGGHRRLARLRAAKRNGRPYQVMVETWAARSKPGGNRNGVNFPLLITPMCRPLAASSRVPAA